MLLRIIYSTIGISLGFVIIIYTKQIVDFTGRSSWGESLFGAGGTYTLLKLIGFLLILISLAYLAGLFNLLGEFFKTFGKMFGG